MKPSRRGSSPAFQRLAPVRNDLDASPEGLPGQEAIFSMCSFWWVEALARAGRLDQAQLAFEKMLTGNFPQAFTHLALISPAYDLDRALG